MIARTPHRVFAALWLAWSIALGWSVVAQNYTARWLVFAAFVVIEGVAVAWNTGSRDTLSEITTYWQRTTSKHRRFARGWNALLLAYVLAIAWAVGDALAHAGLPAAGAVVLGGLVAVWLHDHWMSPDVHG